MPIKPHNLPAAFIKRHADNDLLFQNEFDVSVYLCWEHNDIQLKIWIIKYAAYSLHIFVVDQHGLQLLPDKFKDRTTHVADAPENAQKNRYPDIKACE